MGCYQLTGSKPGSKPTHVPRQGAKRPDLSISLILAMTYKVFPLPGVKHGDRILASVIEQRARDGSDEPWVSVPVNDQDLSQGYRDISFWQLNNYANQAAKWLEENLPDTDESFQCFAYAGPKDLRYSILAVAASKLQKVVCRDRTRQGIFLSLTWIDGAALAFDYIRRSNSYSASEEMHRVPATIVDGRPCYCHSTACSGYPDHNCAPGPLLYAREGSRAI